jgi:hypothetical protein
MTESQKKFSDLCLTTLSSGYSKYKTHNAQEPTVRQKSLLPFVEGGIDEICLTVVYVCAT